jgi:hypothetical protein
MKEINLKIRINNDTGKVGFLVNRNFEDNLSGLFEFIGILDLVKQAHIEKVGEIMRKEKKRETDYGK